jgi:hypothetical protein
MGKGRKREVEGGKARANGNNLVNPVLEKGYAFMPCDLCRYICKPTPVALLIGRFGLFPTAGCVMEAQKGGEATDALWSHEFSHKTGA